MSKMKCLFCNCSDQFDRPVHIFPFQMIPICISCVEGGQPILNKFLKITKPVRNFDDLKRIDDSKSMLLKCYSGQKYIFLESSNMFNPNDIRIEKYHVGDYVFYIDQQFIRVNDPNIIALIERKINERKSD